ncbi:ABC transporter G family member [Trichinella spiralis]|uniref:ABC transporter G family member n=1 Tax=Trichinella spiralis TaxID=6334 RepID=A0ABR3KZ47_TRISP
MKLFLFLFTVFGILYSSCALLGVCNVLRLREIVLRRETAAGVKVKLIDIDTGFDDVMDESEPIRMPCQRRWKVEIPKTLHRITEQAAECVRIGYVRKNAFFRNITPRRTFTTEQAVKI